MFRLWDPLTQNDVSEEDPVSYRFYGVLLRTEQWKQAHSQYKRRWFSGETEKTSGPISPRDEEGAIKWDLPKGCRSDLCKVTLTSILSPLFLLFHQLRFPSIVMLELSCETKGRVTSAWAVPSLVKGNKNVFGLWNKLCCVTDVWAQKDWWTCICYPTKARSPAEFKKSWRGDCLLSRCQGTI